MLSGIRIVAADARETSSSPSPNAADARSATEMADDGAPLTRTDPSAISRSSAAASSFADAMSSRRLRSSPAAEMSARPLLKVVWLPELPMSHVPASVSW